MRRTNEQDLAERFSKLYCSELVILYCFPVNTLQI